MSERRLGSVLAEATVLFCWIWLCTVGAGCVSVGAVGAGSFGVIAVCPVGVGAVYAGTVVSVQAVGVIQISWNFHYTYQPKSDTKSKGLE